MTTCDKCKWADWVRTSNGRLHPCKMGTCTYPWKIPELPASMSWIGKSAPTPFGGAIERGHELSRHCPYWERAS